MLDENALEAAITEVSNLIDQYHGTNWQTANWTPELSWGPGIKVDFESWLIDGQTWEPDDEFLYDLLNNCNYMELCLYGIDEIERISDGLGATPL